MYGQRCLSRQVKRRLQIITRCIDKRIRVNWGWAVAAYRRVQRLKVLLIEIRRAVHNLLRLFVFLRKINFVLLADLHWRLLKALVLIWLSTNACGGDMNRLIRGNRAGNHLRIQILNIVRGDRHWQCHLTTSSSWLEALRANSDRPLSIALRDFLGVKPLIWDFYFRNRGRSNPSGVLGWFL